MCETKKGNAVKGTINKKKAVAHRYRREDQLGNHQTQKTLLKRTIFEP